MNENEYSLYLQRKEMDMDKMNLKEAAVFIRVDLRLKTLSVVAWVSFQSFYGRAA
jgi:hypothetical protein